MSTSELPRCVPGDSWGIIWGAHLAWQRQAEAWQHRQGWRCCFPNVPKATQELPGNGNDSWGQWRN